MRKAIDILFALCAVAIVASVGYYFWSMSNRHVAESDSWVTLDTARLHRKHLFESFPETTIELRYSNTVAGLQGWCFVFAVRAPLADLHSFATQELNEYSGMVFAPMSQPVVRFVIGPCIFLVGVFCPQIAKVLLIAFDDQAVSGTFIWTGQIPTDDELGKPPAKKVSDDFGEQWQYQATEPVVHSIVNSLKQSGEIAVLGDAVAEDHGWHVLLKFGGWKCDLLIQWEGSERERFAFRAHFPSHVYFWLFDQSHFYRQTQQLRSSLPNLLTNSKDIVDVDLAAEELRHSELGHRP